MADFLADHPVSGTLKLYDDLSDEIVEVNLINVSSKEQVWQLSLTERQGQVPKKISSRVWG